MLLYGFDHIFSIFCGFSCELERAWKYWSSISLLIPTVSENSKFVFVYFYRKKVFLLESSFKMAETDYELAQRLHNELNNESEEQSMDDSIIFVCEGTPSKFYLNTKKPDENEVEFVPFYEAPDDVSCCCLIHFLILLFTLLFFLF
jgi:hypothetical protein